MEPTPSDVVGVNIWQGHVAGIGVRSVSGEGGALS